MVNFRLGMMMRRIAGPLSRYADNLPDNQVGFRVIGVIKAGSDYAGGGLSHGSRSPEFT